MSFGSWSVGGGFGMNDYTGQTLPKLEAMGMASVTRCEIQGITSVNGMLKSITTVFNGAVTVMGTLEAQGSQFKERLSVATKVLHLSGSTLAKDLFMMKCSGCLSQTVVLDGSTVEGDITFETGGGKVQLMNRGRLNGRIIGGDYEGDVKAGAAGGGAPLGMAAVVAAAPARAPAAAPGGAAAAAAGAAPAPAGGSGGGGAKKD